MARGYLNYYPGMLTQEAQIWEAFMAANPGKVPSPEYNIRVGQGRDPGPTFADTARQAAILNSQLRLDVVSYDGGAWWIYEVKRGARAGSVGQLLQYELLYEAAYPQNRPIRLAVVTDLPTQGLDLLCQRYGITLFTQPVVFSPPTS
jgi:hypothetical protein